MFGVAVGATATRDRDKAAAGVYLFVCVNDRASRVQTLIVTLVRQHLAQPIMTWSQPEISAPACLRVVANRSVSYALLILSPRLNAQEPTLVNQVNQVNQVNHNILPNDMHKHYTDILRTLYKPPAVSVPIGGAAAAMMGGLQMLQNPAGARNRAEMLPSSRKRVDSCCVRSAR
eukprot:4555381-Pyramimonas_sp.AAC.1